MVVGSISLKQIGMFSFTGPRRLTRAVRLKEEFHVYMTKNGRISMAGLNTGNVDYVAKAIDQVVKGDEVGQQCQQKHTKSIRRMVDL